MCYLPEKVNCHWLAVVSVEVEMAAVKGLKVKGRVKSKVVAEKWGYL